MPETGGPLNRPASLAAAFLLLAIAMPALAQPGGRVEGKVTDETGGVLPGVTVELRSSAGSALVAITDGRGDYSFDNIAPGAYQLTCSMVNFASVTHRNLQVTAGGVLTN